MNENHLTPECQNCRYELTGMEVGDVCPECGWCILVLQPVSRGRRPAILSLYLGLAALFCYLILFGGFKYGHYLFFVLQVLAAAGIVCSLVSKRRTLTTTAGMSDLSDARWGFWLSAAALVPPAVLFGIALFAWLLGSLGVEGY